MDAIELLEKDHREVTKLFERFAAGKARSQVVEVDLERPFGRAGRHHVRGIPFVAQADVGKRRVRSLSMK